MSTPQVRVRITEETEKKLQETVTKISKNAPLGAEVNHSTVVRGAIEDFLNKVEEEEKGIERISYNITNLKEEELKEFDNYLSKFNKEIEDGEENNVTQVLKLIIAKLKYSYLVEKGKYI